jgi:hypothetical protein
VTKVDILLLLCIIVLQVIVDLTVKSLLNIEDVFKVDKLSVLKDNILILDVLTVLVINVLVLSVELTVK